MIARVTLEIALRKEFDYLVPREFQERVEIGSRVKIPFGSRTLMGVVTGLPGVSCQTEGDPWSGWQGKPRDFQSYRVGALDGRLLLLSC